MKTNLVKWKNVLALKLEHFEFEVIYVLLFKICFFLTCRRWKMDSPIIQSIGHFLDQVIQFLAQILPK